MSEQRLVTGRRSAWAVRLAVALTAVATAGLAPSAPAGAAGTTVNGSAFGAAGTVSLQGSPPFTLPPTPSVTLPPAGGTVSDSAPSAALVIGPATFLSTGPLTASTTGSTLTGVVTSTASATNVGPGPFTADSVTSTCTKDGSTLTGSATVTNGQVVLNDTNPPQVVPTTPQPNTTYNGVIPGAGDTFTIIFNEQIVTPDSIVVNGMHMILHGPNAIGDIYVAQSVCGLAASPTTFSCTPGTSGAGNPINICTATDADGLHTILVKNAATGSLQARIALACSQQVTSAVVKLPANTKFKVVVTDCSDPKNKSTFVVRPNGTVRP